MAMDITMADNADVVPYEGSNIAVGWTDTERDEVGLQAEAEVCAIVRYDAVTNWAILGAIEKVLMTKYVAMSIAVQGIAFDMSVYTSRIEGENMINILLFNLRKVEKLLQDQKVLTFIQGGTV